MAIRASCGRRMRRTQAFTSGQRQVSGFKFSNPWFATCASRGACRQQHFIYITQVSRLAKANRNLGGLTRPPTHIGWTDGGGCGSRPDANWAAKAVFILSISPPQAYILTGPPTTAASPACSARSQFFVLFFFIL